MGDDEATGPSKGTTPSKAMPKGAHPGQGGGMLGLGTQSFVTLGAASKVVYLPLPLPLPLPLTTPWRRRSARGRRLCGARA